MDRLPRQTKKAILYCANLPLLRKTGWYLAGGTALALQVGHRQSVDLDFFTKQAKFNEISIERTLFATGHWQTSFIERGTLYGTLLGAKMSFIAYPFFVPSKQFLKYDNIRILLPTDIVAMKIVAISQRGRKRDFVDLYWYCANQEPLAEIINRAVKQYPGQKHNQAHFLKSLTYFADAEADPMPKIFFKASWRDVKKYFRREVPEVARKLLKLDQETLK